MSTTTKSGPNDNRNPATPSDPRPGQLRNLIIATLASTIGFWAWTVIGPLAGLYTKQLQLSVVQTSFLIAMPIFVGSVARVPAGILTDRWGGRIMFTGVLSAAALLVLLTGIAGLSGNFAFLLVSAFLLGIAGAIFSIGIPFASAWYSAERRGFATGVFGMGMVGTAVSAFFTPRLVAGVGYLPAHVVIAAISAAMALIVWVFLRDSPAWAPAAQPALPKLRQAFSLVATYQLCFLYAVVFGAFVAFANYLPTLLTNAYAYDAQSAGTRAAGFAVAAVIARPIGGILADRYGPKKITVFAIIAVIAITEFTAFKPADELSYGPAFLGIAFALGLGSGGIFAWLGKVVPGPSVGTVGGVVAAAGGLGGYFPPLVMGYTYDAVNQSYFIGLTLLSAVALAATVLALVMRRPTQQA